MEVAKVRNYEVWIEGTLGIHKGKPLLYSVYNDYRTAHVAMQRLLKSGRYATLVAKDSK
tara:strand:- start:3025 stop:3201 length:177 start_codon:yes stop_codon:yes gene_type:complete